MKEKVLCICKNIVHCIVEKDYSTLEQNNVFVRVSSDDLNRVLSEYMELNGYEAIVDPPNEFWEGISVGTYNDNSGYWVDVDLWFDDEMSDLTLQIEVMQDGSFMIDDCHVL